MRTAAYDADMREVWERVWRHEPDAARDDRMLARESGSARFALVVGELERRYGSIRGLRTIELGCGRGDLSALLAERGARVTLFDSSDTALSQAERRFGRRGLAAAYVRGDMMNLDAAHVGAFDVALSSGVIEHFRGAGRTQAIASHKRVLCSGGMAVISVPHAGAIAYRAWKAYLELRGWWPYGYEQPYGRREMARRVRAAGFSASRSFALEFWFSVSNQLGGLLVRRPPDCFGRRSVLDRFFGQTLLTFAWRGDG